MYPLRRKPSKLFSKVVILLIWVCGLLFALPMAYAFTYDMVPDERSKEPSGSDEFAQMKPFCFIDFMHNDTHLNEMKQDMFKYYRYVLGDRSSQITFAFFPIF